MNKVVDHDVAINKNTEYLAPKARDSNVILACSLPSTAYLRELSKKSVLVTFIKLQQLLKIIQGPNYSSLTLFLLIRALNSLQLKC